MSNDILLPFKEILKETGLAKSSLAFIFQENRELAKKYLVVKTITFSTGRKAKRYYVRFGFIQYYKENIDQDCTEEEIEEYKDIYYEYVKKEEERIAQKGKSIATEDSLWKDMEIIDANLSKKCLAKFREKIGEPGSYDRRKIARLVYDHIFDKKKYYDIALETLKEEVAKLNEEN